ncbi:hypothetical protein DMB66_03725 [Actinoplanes sp. ATCC 53533]|uniref:hypothetical protein n=1 Tax=Actinoplanes sp. ATCC 53533 TaxID=1288362 RepID=UPI000F78DF66|nr:hypothetical protein [Actinoplanes sp. ATCC 53533]RSM73149.1 hypothetical protein DMB66_03725 [Actinoplanes sp. ATCC 53533]
MNSWADEVAFYEARNSDLRRGRLKALQASATKWSALMAGFLGVFGTVAFAGGLATVDKLPAPVDVLVKATTTLAAVAAALAVWFLSRAAGGLRITDLRFPTGKKLMERENDLVTEARRDIGRGRVCALAAVVLVLAGSVAVLWTPPKPTTPKFLVRFDDAATCGELTNRGGALSIGGRSLGQAVEVIPVSSCPARARQAR